MQSHENKTIHLFVKHSGNKVKIWQSLESQLFTPIYPMCIIAKCEKSSDELTVQVSLLHDHTNFQLEDVSSNGALYTWPKFIRKFFSSLVFYTKTNMKNVIQLKTTVILFYRTFMYNRVLAWWISWLIFIAWAYSSCKECNAQITKWKILANSGTRTLDPRIAKP